MKDKQLLQYLQKGRMFLLHKTSEFPATFSIHIQSSRHPELNVLSYARLLCFYLYLHSEQLRDNGIVQCSEQHKPPIQCLIL